MANGALPLMADSDIASTLALAGVKSFEDGGAIPTNHLNEADEALGLTQQEGDLYRRHLSNLTGPGGVTNPDGSRSTLYQSTQEHEGKFYNVPTVWNGKRETQPYTRPDGSTLDVPNDTAMANIRQEGWDKFPSYNTPEEADSRYDQMHQFMEQDVKDAQGIKSFEPGGSTTPPEVDDWGPVPDAPAQVSSAAPSQVDDVPLPRRKAVATEPEVPGRAPNREPNPLDLAEGRQPAEEDDWAPVEPGMGEQIGTGLKEFGKNVIPAVTSMPAMHVGAGIGGMGGAAIGGALGTLVAGPGPGTLVGAGLGSVLGGVLVGGAAGSLQAAGGKSVQDYLFEKAGIINRAADEEAAARSPTAAAAGQIAAGFVGMNPAAAGETALQRLGTRTVSAGGQAGLNVGLQAAEGQPIDPKEAAMSAAAGFALPSMGRRLERFNTAMVGHDTVNYGGEPHGPPEMQGPPEYYGPPNNVQPGQHVGPGYANENAPPGGPAQGPGQEPGQGMPGVAGVQATFGNGYQPFNPRIPAAGNANAEGAYSNVGQTNTPGRYPTPVPTGEGPVSGALRPDSGSPEGEPPGQGSPGGGPTEGPYAGGGGNEWSYKPWRPDGNPSDGSQTPQTDQLNTPVPGGYQPSDYNYEPWQATKGARAENTAPPAADGLTPKSKAIIAKSKQQAGTSEPVKVGIGTSQVQPAPPKDVSTIGSETSAPFADRNEPGNLSGRKYAKSNTATTNDNPATMTVDDGSGFTPDVSAVMKARAGFNANDNSTTPGKPGARTPGMNETARNEPGNQPSQNDYGFDINRPANENKPRGAEPTPGDHSDEAHDQLEWESNPLDQEMHDQALEHGWYEEPSPETTGSIPGVQETKSARDMSHEAPRAAEQPEHPLVTPERGELWKQAVAELEKRGQHGVIQKLEESLGGEEHASKLLEGIRELDAMEAAQKRTEEAKPTNQFGKKTGDVGTARASNFKMNVADQIMDHYKHDSTRLPGTQAEKAAALSKINEALGAYARTMAEHGQKADFPTKGAMSGGMRWLKAAKRLLRDKDPAIGDLHQFLKEEFFHRHPDLQEMAAETKKIESETRNNRVGGKAENVEEKDPDAWKSGPGGKGYKGASAEHAPSPEELHELQEQHTLGQNLNKSDHAIHQEQRGTQRQRFNTERSKAERLADIDHSKMGTPKQRDNAKSLLDSPVLAKLRELYGTKEDGEGESGSLNIGKINEDFTKGAERLRKAWQAHVGNWWDPSNQGAWGSRDRQLAKISSDAVVHKLARENQEIMHALDLTDAHHATFAYAPEGWKEQGGRAPTWAGRRAAILDQAINFIRRYEHGQEQPTEALQAAAKFWKMASDKAYEMEKDAGARSFYRQNYMPHLFINDAEFNRFSDYMYKKYGPSWFTKERVFDDITEAMEHGFKLKYENPAEIMSQRLIAGSVMRAKMDTLSDWHEYGSAAKVGDENPVALKSNGWEEIVAPNNDKYLLAPEVQPMWHQAMDRENSLWLKKGIRGGFFRAWMTMKAIVVPTMLAWSAFHLQHVAYLHSTTGAGMGAAFNGEKNAYGVPVGAKGIKDQVVGGLRGRARATSQVAGYLAPAVVRAVAHHPLIGAFNKFLKANSAGQMSLDPAIHGLDALTRQAEGFRIMDAFNDPNYKRTAEEEQHNEYMLEAGLQASPHRAANFRAAQGLASAMGARRFPIGKAFTTAAWAAGNVDPVQKVTFGSIQAWKQAQFKAAVGDLFRQHPEYVNDQLLRRAALREIGRNLDDLYGEALNSTKLYNKVFEGVGRGTLLSMDWQMSQLRQEGGAVGQAGRSLLAMAGIAGQRGQVEQAIFNASPQTHVMTRYMGGVLGMSGLMTYLMSGEYPQGLDWVYPRIGGVNDDGTPKRITLPHWHRELVMLAKHYGATDGGLQGAIGAAGELLWSKTILAPWVHQFTNRDFYNREIYDPSAPFMQQLGQRLFSFGREVQPMTFENSAKIDAQGGSGFEKALAFAGMPPAPTYVARSDVQNQIARKFYAGAGAGEKLYVNREHDEDKNRLYHLYNQARLKNDFAAQYKIKKEIVKKGYSKEENIGKHPPNSTDQYMFERLPRYQQTTLLGNMSKEQYTRYVLKNSYIKPGDTAFRELTAAWKDLKR